MRHRGWVVGLMASLIAPAAVQAEGLNVSGGLDARAQTGDEDSFAAGFLNLRQVIEQDGVDRWILVGQLDSGENFESPLLYQTYAQLKGPLGRWNVRAGRFIVPFGLLASYDSERLVLNTIEPLSLALKLDTGVQVSGFVGDHDYAVALTEGSGVGDLSGRMHALKEYTGDQPVVLFFFTSWCPYCHKQIPTLKAIDRGRKALGVKLVTIGAGLEDTADNVRGYALENRLPYVVLYDEGAKVSARYGVKVVPAAFLVRQDGCMTQLGRHVSVAQLTQLR